MKIKYFLVILIGVVVLMVTGCSKTDHVEEENSAGSLIVRIEGVTKSRSIEDLTEADSKIFNYKVYVFGWTSGILEAAVTGNASHPTTITGLSTATTKRVVVLANMGAYYPVVENYSEMFETIGKITLDTQNPGIIPERGYLMSGSSGSEVRLSSSATVEERITISRAVAKISLESLTFIPDTGHEIGKLEIVGVGVQRVAPEVTLVPLKSYYTVGQPDSYHYGGIAASDPELQVRNFLYDDLNLGTVPYEINHKYELGNFFLVFPNDSEENCTLLTISAKYAGEQIYYPIKINSQTGSGNTDGRFVENNKHYKLNVTVKKLGEGTTDPEIPPTDADLDVIVTVEDWDVITQNEVW
ncbi:MAG: hypothetical protein LIO79_07170 [Rikenellaceae bacterium]|nr:hypothetical protein [Rikenellaceae bacterium]